MNEERRQAYLNLIVSLLNCPSGEENQIVQINSELVDVGLVQIMQVEAEKLRDQGNEDAADYLTTVASQLAEWLASQSANSQLEFLVRVLQATSDSKADRNVIYRLLQDNINLVNDNLTEVLRNWAAETLPNLDSQNIRTSYGKVIGNFSNALLEFNLGNKTINLEIAIAGYEVALTIFTRQEDPESWATTQNCLGAAYFQRIRGKKADNLERAIEFCQAAFSVYTRDAFPKQWAMTQSNLASAYKNRIRGEKAENLERAIELYQSALSVYTRDAFPFEWAMTQCQLATAYWERILGKKADNLERAIEFCQAAFSVYIREVFPVQWATTQCTLAGAYLKRIRGEKAENLERAIALFQEALSVYTREGFPEDWANTQGNLATAYKNRIRGEKAENIEKSIEFYQIALSVHTHDAFPEQWAMTKSSLGNAYRDRIRGKKADNLERAIEFYQAALSVYTRDAFPEQWARTQNSFGLAYSHRIRGVKADNLEIAIELYQAALSVYTCNAFPEQWAMTQNNFGLAYSHRIRGAKADNLEIAIELYQAALSVYTCNAFPEQWANTQNNLATAYKDRIRCEKTDNLERAIALFQEVLSVYTREAFPSEWAATQNNLASAYTDRIRGKKADNLEIAIELYQAALSVRTRNAFPEQWANTQNNLASAYFYRIRGEKADNVERAIELFQATLSVYSREAFPEQWANTQNNLAAAYLKRIRGEKADNIEKSIEFSQAALSVYTRDAFPKQWAMTQSNLASAYKNRIRGEKAENVEKSIELYQAALSVDTREAFPFPQDWAGIQNNFGNAYRERIRGEKSENIEKSIELYQAAMLIYTREAFPKDWAMVQNSFGLACLHRIRGKRADNLEKSIEFFQTALSVRTRDEFPINHAETLFNLGLAYRSKSQLSEAYNIFATAIKIVESMRSEIVIGGEADRQKLAEEWNDLSQVMVEVCLEMGNKTAALEYVERSKTRNLVELFHNARSLPNQVQRQPITFVEIRNLLTENEAILEWYITPTCFTTFIITRDSTEPDVWQSSYADLEKLEKFQHEYINDIKDEEKYDDWKNQLDSHLEKLAQILHIDEIISRLPENCQKLILVPFRYLHLFPLHALASSRQKADKTLETGCLLELFPGGVRYTPSCQLLQLSQRLNPSSENASPSRFFAIQNPTEDLDFTDIEVEAIAKSFNPAEVLSRQQASKTAFQQQLASLQNADIAHFSCHGFFDFNNPRQSVLILAGAKIATDNVDSDNKSYIRSPQDELLDIKKCLTLEEIFDLPLSKCSLVTLSACETGLTDIRDNTDEYIGLPSGFLYAGTTNVISTLWAVNDVSTAILMIKFYEIFLSETRPSVAVALRESQLWLRDATVQDLVDWVAGCKLISDERKEEMQNSIEFGKKPENKRYKSPHFWAAFCAIGQ
jgi:CHAT domain-containing protein